MNVLFPDGTCPKSELDELLILSLDGRRRVKELLVKLDETFARVGFTYTYGAIGKTTPVATWEEKQYPSLARRDETNSDAKASGSTPTAPEAAIPPPSSSVADAQPGHLVVAENSKNYSYRRLFAAHLRGAREVTVIDPYVRAFWQVRNFMELVQLVRDLTPEGEETKVRLITKSDPDRCVEQDESLRKIQESCTGSRVSIEYDYDAKDTIHARSVTTDTGWKISLDRGLDIFLRYEIGPFSIASSVQEERLTKAFEVTYLRTRQSKFHRWDFSQRCNTARATDQTDRTESVS
jgi:ATP-dependent Lon protease